MPLTREQQALRRTGIGASEVPALARVSPYGDGPLDVWLRKKDLAAPIEENVAMESGHRLEPVIAQWYADDTGIDPARLVLADTLRHPAVECALATPDRLLLGVDGKPVRNVQVKNVGGRMGWRWTHEDDGVPDDVRVQIEWEMAVVGVDETDVAVLIAGTDFRVYRIKRDPELGEALLDVGQRFWRDHVLADVPPQLDETESTLRYLRARYPRSGGGTKEAAPTAGGWVHQWREASAAEKEAESRRKFAEAMLKDEIGDADGITGPWGKASWKLDQRGRVRWEAVARALGATEQEIEKHREPPPRRFLVSKAKETSR